MYINSLQPRQGSGGVDMGNNPNNGNDVNDDGWWGETDAAIAVKWAIIGAIVLLILLWFIGGYYHAKRRMNKGLPPLLYHRFLVSRRVPPPQQQQFSFYQDGPYGQTYPMNAYPPPAYNPNHPAPPEYHNNEMSKVSAQQTWNAASQPNGPPNGPSPGQSSHEFQHVRLDGANASNQAAAPPNIPGSDSPTRQNHTNPFLG